MMSRDKKPAKELSSLPLVRQKHGGVYLRLKEFGIWQMFFDSTDLLEDISSLMFNRTGTKQTDHGFVMCCSCFSL